MGFFNLYKPKKYDYRYIYYDPKEEAKKEREKKMKEGAEHADEFKTSIRRGTFREEASRNKSSRSAQVNKSNIRLILIILVLLLLAYFLLL